MNIGLDKPDLAHSLAGCLATTINYVLISISQFFLYSFFRDHEHIQRRPKIIEFVIIYYPDTAKIIIQSDFTRSV